MGWAACGVGWVWVAAVVMSLVGRCRCVPGEGPVWAVVVGRTDGRGEVGGFWRAGPGWSAGSVQAAVREQVRWGRRVAGGRRVVGAEKRKSRRVEIHPAALEPACASTLSGQCGGAPRRVAAAENEPGLVPYTLVIAAAWFAGLRCRRTRTPPERHMAIWVVEVVVQVIVLLVSRVVRNVWCVRGRFDLYCDKPHRRVRGANHAG